MQIVVLTIVVSLYMGSEPVSSKWMTMNMDSMRECELVSNTLRASTIVDNSEYWAGSKYVITTFCDNKVIERLDDNESN